MSIRLPISGYSFIFLILFISLSGIRVGCGGRNKDIKFRQKPRNTIQSNNTLNNRNDATDIIQNASNQQSIPEKFTKITQDQNKKYDNKIKKNSFINQEIDDENYEFRWQGAATIENMARAQAQAEKSNIKNQFSLQEIGGFIKSKAKKWIKKFMKPKVKKRLQNNQRQKNKS